MSITIVSSFIIQANVITIINYDRKTFIVQATASQQLRTYELVNIERKDLRYAPSESNVINLFTAIVYKRL